MDKLSNDDHIIYPYPPGYIMGIYSSGYTDYSYTPSTEEILDQLDIKDIENYVRKKKLEKVSEVVKERRSRRKRKGDR